VGIGKMKKKLKFFKIIFISRLIIGLYFINYIFNNFDLLRAKIYKNLIDKLQFGSVKTLASVLIATGLI
jgi:hypothetical protein